MTRKLGTIYMACPICLEMQNMEHMRRTRLLTAKNTKIDPEADLIPFQEEYMHCPSCNSDFIPARMMDENLTRFRNEYTEANTTKVTTAHIEHMKNHMIVNEKGDV